jgi:hypothetical protein
MSKNAHSVPDNHVTDSVPVNRIDRYRRDHPELLRINPYLGTYFFRVNVTKPTLNNRLVRRALAMAIDRQAIVEKIWRGGQVPAGCFTRQTPLVTPAAHSFLTMSILHAKHLRRLVMRMATACRRSKSCSTVRKTTSSRPKRSSKCGGKI